MTRIRAKRFMGAAVRTRSGLVVGKVIDIEFDADDGRMAAICVKTGLVAGLIEDQAVIAWSQIVSMNEREVIVEDGISVQRKKGLASLSIERFAQRSSDAVMSDGAESTC
ncbi:MAG: PRC-barrel domain-containing protein [Candidatus Uhrbacteria bacterium]|nr:PRC-barrel domain-containing protein [Candidatus Uhrbacteria bacterium]